VEEAIGKCNLHRSGGSSIVSSDHFVNVNYYLSDHISCLLTTILSHGSVTEDFVTNSEDKLRYVRQCLYLSALFLVNCLIM